jgi:hypothetical protein
MPCKPCCCACSQQTRFSPLVLQLSSYWASYSSHKHCDKSFQMVNSRFPTMTYLKWCLSSFHSLAWHMVEDLHCSNHIFPPKPSRQPLCFQHAACCTHNHRILVLDNTILLRGVWCRELPVHIVQSAVLHECLRVELVALVCVQCSELRACNRPGLYDLVTSVLTHMKWLLSSTRSRK